MSSPDDVVILPVSWDHPDSVHLRNTQRAEITSLGGVDPGTPPSAADIPIFLVAYHAGLPVGCGGLRPLSLSPSDCTLSSSRSSDSGSVQAAEIKRMFVDPSHRGIIGKSSSSSSSSTKGGVSVAELILARLEHEAAARGWTLLLLETGVFLAQARRFYERRGFVQRAMFGGYSEADNSVCYEKRLGSGT